MKANVLLLANNSIMKVAKKTKNDKKSTETSSRPIKFSARVYRNRKLLLELYKTTDLVRNTILSTARKDLIETLVECAQNLIKGNVSISATHYKELKKRKEDVRKFVSGKRSLKLRKEILQTGGFLGLILKPLLKLFGVG